MLRFLLDTNVLCDIVKAQPEPVDLIQWLEDHVDDCFLSAITIHEMEFGTAQLAVRKSPEDRLRASKYMSLNRELFVLFSGRVLSVGEYVLFRAAALRAKATRICGDIGMADAIIAATAEKSGLCVMTRNIYQLSATGVRVVDSGDLLPSLARLSSCPYGEGKFRSIRNMAQKPSAGQGKSPPSSHPETTDSRPDT